MSSKLLCFLVALLALLLVSVAVENKKDEKKRKLQFVFLGFRFILIISRNVDQKGPFFNAPLMVSPVPDLASMK